MPRRRTFSNWSFSSRSPTSPSRRRPVVTLVQRYHPSKVPEYLPARRWWRRVRAFVLPQSAPSAASRGPKMPCMPCRPWVASVASPPFLFFIYLCCFLARCLPDKQLAARDACRTLSHSPLWCRGLVSPAEPLYRWSSTPLLARGRLRKVLVRRRSAPHLPARRGQAKHVGSCRLQHCMLTRQGVNVPHPHLPLSVSDSPRPADELRSARRQA